MMYVRWRNALGIRRLLTLAVALLIALLLIVVASLASRPGPARAATVTIPMGGYSFYGFWFCDASHSGNVCTTTIQVGDTVTWQNQTADYHTSRECDGSCGAVLPPSPLPLWDSGPLLPSDTFSRQFNQAGTFNYQCNIQPTQMKGQIIVLAATTATQTLTPTSTQAPTSTPTPAPAVGGISLDPAQLPPSGSAGYGAALLAALVAAGITTMGGAAWWVRRRSNHIP
jgi:hypothetical protein